MPTCKRCSSYWDYSPTEPTGSACHWCGFPQTRTRCWSCSHRPATRSVLIDGVWRAFCDACPSPAELSRRLNEIREAWPQGRYGDPEPVQLVRVVDSRKAGRPELEAI
jgi:hypothetical protein